MRQTGECHDVNWLIENYLSSDVDEEDIIYETDMWVAWGGLIDWELHLSSAAPLVTSAVDEEDIFYKTEW